MTQKAAEKKKEKPKIIAPDMNPQILRADACAEPKLWAEKYRRNPRQRGRDFEFKRQITEGQNSFMVPLAYLTDLYETLKRPQNLLLVIQKARQARISEFCINGSFFWLDTIPGFTMLYVFPDDVAGRRFLLKRIDEPINDSAYLSFMVSSLMNAQNIYRKRRGAVDSLDIKRVGLSWFYMLASKSKSASRSPDADATVFDEYDIHDMTTEESFLSTMDDSEYRAKIYISTPTNPHYGITLRYATTSMGKWFVNCSTCLEDFEMNSEYFFGSGIKVLKVPRELDGAERIFVCPHCGAEVNSYDKQARGRWVHAQPGMIKHNRIGFQFSNLILPHINAGRAWQDFLDFSVKPGGRKKFFNEKLGEPATDDDKSARFTREGMLKCTNKSFSWLDDAVAHDTMIGVDWGKETHVVVWKFHEEKLRLLNFFVFPPEKEPMANAKKVMKLIPRFNPKIVVTDFGGGQEQNKYLYERIRDILFIAVHKNTLKDMSPAWDKKSGRVHYELCTSYSTYARWYSAEMVELPVLDDRLEVFIQHHTNSCLITPNQRANVPDGVLLTVGRDEPQEVGHTGPIHLLSASIFGWMKLMGKGASSFHFSERPKENVFSGVHAVPDLGFDNKAKTVQDVLNRGRDISGRKVWQP